MKRLKQLEEENSRLKQIVADLTLDREMLQVRTVKQTIRGAFVGQQDPAKALKPDRMRAMVRGMCRDWSVSIRTACGAMKFDGSTFHFKSRRIDQAAVAKRIKERRSNASWYGRSVANSPAGAVSMAICVNATARPSSMDADLPILLRLRSGKNMIRGQQEH